MSRAQVNMMKWPVLILLTSTPMLHATKCMEDCTQFKIELPPKPESGYNTGKAVAAILNGILTIVRAKTFGVSANDFGYIGGGLFGGLWGATVDAQEAAKMQEYQLAKGLKQTQDYLACVMESQVSGALYQINERMDNDRVSMFNSAIQGIVSYQSDNCAAHNCLNATMIEPSKRNEAVGAACMTAYPVAKGSDCTDVAWNPRDPVLCQGRDSTGTVYEGVCGADNRCWHTEVGFGGAIKAYQALKMQFLAKDAINNFDAFNDLRNPTAVVAYAKGALVYLSVLQELHLLGSATAEDGTARLFAQRAADWLQNRVDYHTNVNVTLVTVQDANDANPFNQEPIAVRRSCKPGDVQHSEVWLGCSKAGSGFTKDTNFCLMKPNSMGWTHWQHLCMGVCNDAIQKANAFYSDDKPNVMTTRTIGSLLSVAAKELANENKQLFNSSGVYDVIASLRQLAVKSMPDNSHAFYQHTATPKWLCNAPKLLGTGAHAPTTVAPLTKWEEPDNLSKGSVVLRGVVIGGKSMAAAPSKAPTAASPAAPSKRPTAAPAAAHGSQRPH